MLELEKMTIVGEILDFLVCGGEISTERRGIKGAGGLARCGGRAGKQRERRKRAVVEESGRGAGESVLRWGS